MKRSIIALAATTAAALGAGTSAHAQYAAPGGYPASGPQMRPMAVASPLPQGQQGQAGSYNGATNASPQLQALFSNTGWRAIQGEMMQIATYAPNGECGTTIGTRRPSRQRPINATYCRYEVTELGGGRFAYRSVVTLNGQTQQSQGTARIMPNGTVRDEASGLTWTRIQ